MGYVGAGRNFLLANRRGNYTLQNEAGVSYPASGKEAISFTEYKLKTAPISGYRGKMFR